MCVRARACVLACVCVHTYVHAREHVCMCVHICVCARVHICVCMCACVKFSPDKTEIRYSTQTHITDFHLT